MKKMPIGRSIYDIITEEKYIERTSGTNSEEIKKELAGYTAIEKDNIVYPLLPSNSSKNTVGVKDFGNVLLYQKPETTEQQEQHSSSHIIDLSNNNEGIKGMIRRQAELEQAEKSILISKDNVTTFMIKEEDTPEMALFKEALNSKRIDMSSYRDRHGSDFSNNMRLLTSSNNITFGKMKAIAKASDIEIEIKFRDKPGCVNPMGTEFSTVII